MRININNLATLANLSLTKKQKEDLALSLPSIISYMDEIKQLDVDSIHETTRVTEEENVLREDVVTSSLSQEEALQNAKETHNGFFVVPAILDKKA